jgi:site-specific DNA recombinase
LTGYLLSEFERHGAQLISVTDPLEDTSVGKLLISVKEFVAEVEREKIKERSMRGKYARIKSGKLPGFGPDLYGYRRNEFGTRDIVESEATIIRSIFDMVTVEHMSARAIAGRLNDLGVPPPSDGKYAWTQKPDKRWTFRSVARLVHNDA